MVRKLYIPLTEAKQAAQKLAKTLKGGETIALIGQLGSGKTTFTQALGEALGIRKKILSPTFVLMQRYPVPGTSLFFYHLDLYRTKGWADIVAVGLPEIWTRPDTITIIEWADKIRSRLPAETPYIYLKR